MDIEEIEEELKTSLKTGLSSEEAKRRLEKYGYNEIPEKKVHPLIKFLSYFWNPIAWMIEIAAILSAIIKHWIDFTIIMILLIVNGIIGFWEEHKAENVIEYLKQKMALNARVLRDGKWQVIPAKELVPGDVVRIRIGDIVPADIILVEGDYLVVDESALTGESLPVEKKVGDIAYSGSIVKKGEMTGVVKATGLNTYFGKTVKLVEKAKRVSSYQKMIVKIGNYLMILAIILIGIMVAVELYRGKDLIETAQFALVLAVSAIPAAMPAVLSITMAIGALNLAKKDAIVKKLVAIEELAGVDILCSDKTGTLTKNQLVCGDIIPMNGFTKEDVILYASLASREEDADAIDMAILNEAKKLGLIERLKKYKVKKFIPFDPVIKRTEATITNDEEFKVSKGAPQVILDLCEADEKLRKEVEDIVDKLAESGYRALGVAVYKNGKWHFVGIIPLYDPPREDAPLAVKKIKELGVIIKMVTGDHIAIAKNIARMLGIGDKIISIRELLEKLKRGEIKEEKFDDIIEEADGFAEVFPEHKYKIVDALQNKGHLVAMTGDGVNDAPALKKADCGIAVSNATDAARAAADIILLSPGISVIVDAIQEARRIFQRMESYIIYRIAETIRILFFIELCILLLGIYPITALMIVLLAILNDIPILAIAYDNVVETKHPAKWKMKEVLLISTIIGFVGVAGSFIVFYIADKVLHLSLSQLQTFVFLKLILAGHVTIFITRIKDWMWKPPYPHKLLFWGIMGTNIIGTIVAAEGILMSPIGWGLALFLWVFAILEGLCADVVKMILLKKIKID
ncbi:plasma-membrane proton-efflux P-type ATPase [Methanocaldococcus vulcanius M7]|uniref:Plasma-membrane proton-efflux P-type ATPase n=1 Tax=Methanocaldococcus vulcanius (strain ATCC 700851 / DSM 12094 / M7) TaxID=579137 RepID=C9RGM9_METVM|nr:plasma-membrane proton-efflux P-type ATPase [Methanocaldococcus vulcanius]ACX72731.1 plasma-membrane proton-efflux P-type ATPase [Methanocaldococcus vulcanius M7]